MTAFELEKDVERVNFVLEKHGVQHFVRAGVALDLDVSGSMQELYSKGVVQRVVERILPLAIACDDNGRVDVWGFSSDVAKACDVFRENYQGYVEAEMLEEDGELTSVLWGGTSYAPPIRANLEHFGLLQRKRGGFFRRQTHEMVEESSLGLPIIVYFITDGENSDPDEAWQLFEELQAADSQVYFMLVGVGNARYQFLRRAAETFPNVGFLAVPNLARFVSDETVFDQLLPGELCAWLKHEGEEEEGHHA